MSLATVLNKGKTILITATTGKSIACGFINCKIFCFFADVGYLSPIYELALFCYIYIEA